MEKHQITNLLEDELSFDEIEQINEIDYGVVNFENDVVKLGYCCEEMQTFDYPIYIKFENEEDFKEIKISLNGIYEIQSEKTTDSEGKKVDIDITISAIKLPIEYKWILDYYTK